jgi:hypothetical protein
MEELDITGRNIGVTFDGNPVLVLSEPILPVDPLDALQSEKRSSWDESVGNMELSFSVPTNKLNPNFNQLFLLDEQPKVKVIWNKKGKKKLRKLFKRMCKQYKRKDGARV